MIAGSMAIAFAQIPAPTNGPSGSASGQQIGSSLIQLMSLIQNLVNIAVPLLIGVAVVALFVGIIMFLVKGKDGAEHAKWGKFMGMAILALFVMVSIWGLVNFIGSIVGVGQGGGIPTPVVPRGIN